MKRRWAAALALILSLSMGCLQVLPAYAAQETSGQTSDEGQPDPAPPDSDSETSPPAGPDQTGDPSGSEALPAQTPPEAASDNPDQTQTEGDPSNPQPDPSEPVDENKNPAEQTHGKTEYEASLGTNTVRIHCSQDAFPAGTVLEAKPLSANLPELQKLSSDEGMSAFGLDIQFLSEDGKIIEPAVPVQAEITVSADEFSSEIEASGIRLFHAETDGLKQVETSSMKLEDGKIKAVFTADSFSPFIFQARTKEKSEEEAKPDEETADAADQKDQPQAQSEDPEPEINNLYCYTLIPGMTFNPQVIANAEWNGMGVGEVLGLPAPQLPSGTSKNYIHDPGVQIIYPVELGQSTYPDITATSSEDGATATYKYAAPGSGNEYKEGYYTIDWNQLVEASGANSGHNDYNPVVYAGVPTYHLNGVIYLNQKHLITVSFYAQIPGQKGFTFINATRVEKGSTGSLLESDHLVPELDPQTYPEYRFYNGTLYRLKYWSASQDVAASFASENLSAFNQPMTGNTAFYAGYEPIEASSLVISKEVSGKGAEPDRQFIFTLDLNAGKDFGNIPYELSEDYIKSAADYSFEKTGPGQYRFLLKHGQSLPKIPVVKGSEVKITETDGASEGYSISWTVNEVDKRNSGAELKQTIDQDTHIVCKDNKETWTVRFLFKNPNEGFHTVLMTQVPAETTTLKTLKDDGQVPSLADKQKTQIIDGIIYTLHTWSESESFDPPADFSSNEKVKNNEVFYAGYLAASERNLTIHKEVEGKFAEEGRKFRSVLSLSYDNQPFTLNPRTAANSGLKAIAPGEYELYLEDGQKVSIPVCEGVHWSIEEDDYTNDGYDSKHRFEGEENWTEGRSSLDHVTDSDQDFYFLNTKESITARFMFRNAGDTEFKQLSSEQLAADSDSLYSMKQDGKIPSLDSYPQEVLIGDKAYRFEVWNYSEGLAASEKVNFDNRALLDSNLTLYAGYIPVDSVSLAIAKTVVGSVLPDDTPFEFTLKLEYDNQPVEIPADSLPEGVQSKGKGTYSISLKDGDSAVFSRLPANTNWTLEENDYASKGYRTLYRIGHGKNVEARKAENQVLKESASVHFINEKLDWQILFKLRKAGSTSFDLIDSAEVGADTSTEQTLLSENKVPSLSNWPETIVQDGHVYHLKKWSRNEQMSDLTDFDDDRPLTDGEIFYAAYVPVAEHSLSINKTVTGKGAEKDRSFELELSLKYNGKPFIPSRLDQDDTLKAVKAGVYSFTLKDGQTVTLPELPEGVEYSVSEKDSSKYGYTTSWQIGSSDPKTGLSTDPQQLMAASNVYFVNNKETWTIEFRIEAPDSDTEKNISILQVGAVTSTMETLKDRLPKINDEEWPERMAVNGKIYVRSEWYTDKDLQTEADFNSDEPLHNEEIFYAGYKPLPEKKLSVSKKTEGKGVLKDRSYGFTLVLNSDGDPFALTKEQIEANGLKEISRGQYGFSLKAGETRTFSLPETIQADIAEEDVSEDGYRNSYSLNGQADENGGTCVIDSLNQDSQVQFTNIKEQITVYFKWLNPKTKQMELLDSILVPKDTTTQQDLLNQKLIPSESSLNQYMTVDGTAWILNPDWYTSPEFTDTTDFKNSSILENEQTFYLHYEPAAMRKLTIQKELAGAKGEEDRHFNFNLNLKWGGTSYNMSEEQAKKQNLVLNGNGYYSFWLKGGQSITLELPANTIYHIDEQNLLDDGFRTTWNDSDSQSSAVETLIEDTVETCTNFKESWTVNFWLKQPGEKHYDRISSVQVPADTSTLSTLLYEQSIPDMVSRYPKVVRDGVAYALKYWYSDPSLQDKVDFAGKQKLYNEENFYAAYVPLPTHALTISKMVTGSGAEKGRKFGMTLDLKYGGAAFGLSEEDISKYHITANPDKTYHLELEAGESIRLHLPEETSWQVIEDDMSRFGYSASVNGQKGRDSGTHVLNADDSVSFTNHKDTWTVSFVLIHPNDAEKQTIKEVQVPADTTTYENLVHSNMIPDMQPYDVNQAYDGQIYELDDLWYNTEQCSEAVDFNSANPVHNQEIFYMHYVPMPLHNLTIAKEVTGKASDPNREFDFTLHLYWNEVPFSANAAQMERSRMAQTEEGTYTFSLKAQESITLKLPEQVRYSIEEADMSDLGYTASWNDIPGRSTPVKPLENDCTETCTNHKDTWTVNFLLKEPDAKDYTLLDSVEVPADTSVQSYLKNNHMIPPLENRTSPVVKDGKVWILENKWYMDPDLKVQTDFDNDLILENNECFYAAYVPAATHTLSISKKVTGSGAEKNRDFKFDLYLSYDNTPFVLDEDTMKKAGIERSSVDGFYHFTLKHGQSTGDLTLPEGIFCQIYGNNYAKDGYSTHWNVNGQDAGDSEALQNFRLMQDTAVECVNHKDDWTIFFKLKKPDGTNFETLKRVEVPADTSTLQTLQQSVPSLSDQEKKIVVDGVGYEIEGWFSDPELRHPIQIEGNQKLFNEETFYAAYEPVPTVRLDINKNEYGQAALRNRNYRFDMSLEWNGQPLDLSENAIETSGLVQTDHGKYSFFLKDGDRVSALRLPQGTKVHLKEEDLSSYGFKTSWTITQGDSTTESDTDFIEIPAMDQAAEACCNNVKESYDIIFKLRRYGDTEFKHLKTVQVPADTSTLQTLLDEKKIPDLPDQTWPEKTVFNGVAWQLKCWSSSTMMNDQVDFNQDTPLRNQEVFYAAYEPVETHFLDIDKTVVGNEAKPDEPFDFTLKVFWNDEPFVLSKEQMTAAGLSQKQPGVYTFVLKNGQNLKPILLPEGTSFTVEEDDYSKEGYQTSVKNGTSETKDRTFADTLEEDEEIHFINSRSQTPSASNHGQSEGNRAGNRASVSAGSATHTGRIENPFLSGLLLAGSAAGMSGLLIGSSKKNKKKKQ